MAEFGAELRRRREAAGLSLTQFAPLTHFSKGYLSKVETGNAPPNRSLAEICDRVLDADGELLALVPDEGEHDREPVTALPALPTPVVGRAAEIDRLATALSGRPAVHVVTGLGGIGKTTVAVAAARAVAERFPDGQFLVDLGPPGATAPTESECLDRALRALGVPGRRIPPDLAGRALLFRDRVRRKRILLLVDDATSAGQLRSLRSGGPGCRVLVTSRRRLTALDDADHLELGPLPDDPAGALFRQISGTPPGDPVDEFVRRCGSVPLAIRIVAARVRRGGWTPAEILDRLTDEASRIPAMDDGERSMAAVFAVSLDGLAGGERDLLVLLGLHPGPAADLPATAALAGLPPIEVESVLIRLYESCLVTREPGGFVVLPDLVRAHLAATELPRLPAAYRDGAVRRLVDHLVARVAAADAVIEPHRHRPGSGWPAAAGFGTAAEAGEWLRRQWPVAVAVADQARAAGLDERCWQLGFLLRGYFFRERLTGPWLHSGRIALAAAEQAGQAAWVGMSLNSLGMAYLESGDPAEAARCHLAAEEVFGAVGDERGALDSRSSLAWVRLYEGAYEQARRGFEVVLADYRRLGRPRNECIALRGLALAAAELGHDASEYVREATALAQTPVDQAMTANCAGWVHYRAGRYDAAARDYAAAAERARPESRYELVRALTGLGNAAAAAGNRDDAGERWREADEHQVFLDAGTVGEAGARRALSTKD
ncbi:MAG TPA: helix-turn-helix domain-containing protein [Mycobacteriales bacterium]|nr:helix-turn-helix domain-containing protein [Mycobacteriales bacterium]